MLSIHLIGLFFCLTLHALQISGSSNTSVRFLVLGDWGGLPSSPFTTAVERAIAQQMDEVAYDHKAQFFLALGDNFYYDGVQNSTDKRFHETFERVFTGKSTYCPWYLIAGNHDHHGSVPAQIAYSKQSPRWNFPDYNYTLQFRIPNTSRTVRFVMIDTVILCGNTDDRSDEQLMGPEDETAAENQWVWIDEQLKSSKDAYLIVAGHYPVYSIAEHGPTDELVKRLDPMLHKYNVTAFFSGHDHNLQHLQYTDHVYKTLVDYFVIGSANFINASMKHINDVPKDSLRFHWANLSSLGGFAQVVVTERNLTFTFVRAGGFHLYTRIMYPRWS